MNFKIGIVALSILVLAVTAAEARTKKPRHRVRPLPPVAAAPWDQVPQNLWAGRCTTDEGYGRRLPCDYGGK